MYVSLFHSAFFGEFLNGTYKSNDYKNQKDFCKIVVKNWRELLAQHVADASVFKHTMFLIVYTKFTDT